MFTKQEIQQVSCENLKTIEQLLIYEKFKANKNYSKKSFEFDYFCNN